MEIIAGLLIIISFILASILDNLISINKKLK